MRNQRLYAITFSFMLHGMILALAMMMLTQASPPIIGIQNAPSIKTYLYQEAQTKAAPLAQHLMQQAEKITSSNKHAIAIKKVISQQKPEAQTEKQQAKKQVKTLQALKPATQNAASEKSKGAPTNTLLALLHTAIQKQQHYPLSAQQMEREGRVSVQFILLEDGRIKGLHMVKSSGTASLDEAALQAVQAASPFAHINQYLSKAQEFSIDVVFELG